MKFMTFNIRHDHGPQSLRESFTSAEVPESLAGEQPWAIRKWKVADTVLLWSPDIVGFQEPEHHQVIDLQSLLHDEYDWVGAGRNDGNEDGEYCPVFYKRELLKVNSWKTLWLSKEPETPGSKGWDASHPRIANWVEFERKSDGSKFTLLNAHFDHQGVESRRGAAQLILERVQANPGLTVLMGDLNSPEDDPGYQTLTGGGDTDRNDTMHCLEELNDRLKLDYATKTGEPVRTSGPNANMTLPTHRVMRPGQILQNLRGNTDGDTDTKFVDTRYELATRLNKKPGDTHATMSGPLGDKNTFTSFGAGDPDQCNAPRRLDYIMMMKHQNVTVRRFGVLSNIFDDNLYISDHRPVVAELEW
ncbi:hypothetical protein O0I10_001460 [Lichtheimia ornata]|uniref:Endonuclease/exonuclease/phosphatase domain-containing protein n=1 Tax=Lichtheimia ornata TaxID=688661 RepID=A0AAD7VBL1_9FUNG|nr:uncharacterized protein O0I10_001460 [Lichtheimia ornata]KAJ8662500.1 hypothetical protein O0I10_001460 [Lichtheimia ornata]